MIKKLVCAPEKLIPQHLEAGIKYVAAYSNPHRCNVGYFGTSLIRDIRRNKFYPSVKVWDFNTIALSVAAADNCLSRNDSPDGWTRQIDLTIHLCQPDIWDSVKQKLESILRFLTGDFWKLTFKNAGTSFPPSKHSELNLFESSDNDEDCVCLLSGGMDSLVGAIDLVSSGHKPIFVSQTVRGDAKTQCSYAQTIRSQSRHFSSNHNIKSPDKEKEGSTRGRSIVFFAFAALAASVLRKATNIYVPENGFISLNIPLNLGRMGSFSTKTTHPVYLRDLQDIWDKVGIPFNLVTPYQFKTKGEILTECKNQHLLKQLIFQSVSCGKYRVYKMQHCGRCVPCLVRRAAFQHWGEVDRTLRGYNSENLGRINHGNPDDVGAAINACIIAQQQGIHRLIAGNLSFADRQSKKKFEDVFSRGLREIELFLKTKGLL